MQENRIVAQRFLKRIRCHDCFEKQRELDKVKEVEKIVYQCLRGICKQCTKVHTAQPPVLPRSLYGNELLAHSLDFHYCRGMSLGKLLDFLGPHVNDGGLIQAFHRIAVLLEPALEKIFLFSTEILYTIGLY